MEKKIYQEPNIRVYEISNKIIATSNGMEDWGSAGTGSGTLNSAKRSIFDDDWDEDEYEN